MYFDIKHSPVIAYDGLSLGTLSNGMPFFLPPNLLSNHVAILGQTGTGKTRLAMDLAAKIEKLGATFLVMDVESEWKGIIPLLSNETEYYASDVNLQINPFDLKDAGLIRELMRETVFKGIEQEYSDLSAQMQYVLNDAINDSKSMPDLIRNVSAYDKEKLTNLDRTKTALKVRLEPFMREPLSEVFNTSKSNPDLERLGEKNIFIDLHPLDARVAYNKELRLIYNTITAYFLRKMLSNGMTDGVSNLFVCDEAQLLVPKILRKLIVTESWPATEFATRLRKRGCGVMIITQSPSNIEKDIFRNAGTKVVFRTQEAEDLRMICDSFGFIDNVEREYLSNVLVKLDQREAIVHTIGIEPFLLTAATFRPAPVSPEELDKHTPVPEVEVPEIVEPEFGFGITEDTFEDAGDTNLEEEQVRFLESISKEPFIGRNERKVRLGIDSTTYSKIVSVLLDRGLIEKVNVFTGSGRPKVLYEIKGQNPGVKHQFYVEYVLQELRRMGIQANAQKTGADIALPSLRTAINVELGTSNIYKNVATALESSQHVIVCSDDADLLVEISSKHPGIATALVWDVPRLLGAQIDKGQGTEVKSGDSD
jgi:predicted transcriptional regulator